MKQLSPRALQDVVWRAVADQLELDPDYDRDGAVKVADYAKNLMKWGWDAQQARARRRVAHTVGVVAAWLATIAVVFGGIGFGVYEAFHVRANDYAHTDPSSVADGGYYFLRRWYGQNDLPDTVTLRSKSHSQVDGHAAWLTRWDAGGKQVCAFVWGRSNPGTPHETYGKVVDCP